MLTKISELKILDVQAAVNADYRDKGSSRKTLKSALSLINSALVAQGYDYHLCKSYLTQKKEPLTDREMEVIARTPLIFGCDECQRVCPHNKGVPITPIVEFRQNRLTMLRKEDIESLTNRQFRTTYGNRPFSWRGKKILLRNLDIVHAKTGL